MSNVNTDDTPVELAILPDWSQAVEVQIQFSTAVQRSWSGRDQRSRKREKPLKIQRYNHTGLTEQEARSRLLALKEESRQPVYTPFWADGIPIAVMPTANDLTLDVAPIEGEWDNLDKVYIWDEVNGGEFRDLTSVIARDLVLGGTGTIYPAGAFVFPCPKQVREPGETMIQRNDILDGNEIVVFRTL